MQSHGGREDDRRTGLDAAQRVGQALRVHTVFAQTKLTGKQRRIKARDLEQHIAQRGTDLRIIGCGFGPRGTAHCVVKLVGFAAHLIKYLARRQRRRGYKAGDDPEQDHAHRVLVRLRPDRPVRTCLRHLVHQPLQEPRLCGCLTFSGR